MVNFHVRLGTVFLDLSMLPHVNNVCKSAFYHLRTISCIGEQLSMQTTEILIHAFVTCKLDHCNSLLYNHHHHHHIMPLKTSPKSFNQCRMQLPDRLHALGSVITLILFDFFTDYLFLNEFNSRFYYLRLCISNLQPTFKT